MKKRSVMFDYLSKLDDLRELISKTNKMSVLILSPIPVNYERSITIHNIVESISNIICFVDINDLNYIPEILSHTEGCIDRIVLDVDDNHPNSKELVEMVLSHNKQIPVLYYSHYDIWGDNSVDFIIYKENGLFNKSIFVCGTSPLASRVITKLLKNGARVFLSSNEYSNNVFECGSNMSISICNDNLHIESITAGEFDIIIGISVFKNALINDKIFAHSIYDVGLNNFSKEYIKQMRERGAQIFRYDNRAGISSALLNLLETEYLVKYNMGEIHVGEICVVSGGVMGEDGTVVVDNAYNPNFIVGIANGSGLIKSNSELSKKNIDDMCTIKKLISYKKRYS